MTLPGETSDNPRGHEKRGCLEVLQVFLRLGLTSFGGPIAHLGYFHREFVENRRWLNDAQFAQLLALCQFLPGPASSQMGFSIGLLRSGWCGALSAFVAFTAPSAILLFLFALVAPHLAGPYGNAVIHGLKLVALVVVAHGVTGMASRLCPDWQRATIAGLAILLMLAFGGVWMQLASILLGAALGLGGLKSSDPIPDIALPIRYGRKTGLVLWCVFLVLLMGLSVLGSIGYGYLAIADAFFRSGALVFGGGHVVLPFLEETLVSPGWLAQDVFMAGYGAAQAVPGPMFSLAAYLGAHLPGGAGGLPGAVIALTFIFMPGFLLISCALPLWRAITTHPAAGRAIAGVNAAVVGLLGAALYDPIWSSAVGGVMDVAIAAAGFALLAWRRQAALLVVLWCVLASVMAA